MTTQNSEKQKRYRENRIQSGERQLTCWLGENDNDRLLRLMASLGYGEKGKVQDGYTEVIRMALVQLESQMNRPRYGLVMLAK
jgi:hypothetical protein